MRETSYQLRYYSGGSHPSEAHGGGWEGLWQGGMGTAAVIASVPLHPQPMEEDGGSFWQGGRGSAAVIASVPLHPQPVEEDGGVFGKDGEEPPPLSLTR